MKKILLEAGAGLVGGLIGTLAVQQLVKWSGKLPQRFQPRYRRDPAEHLLAKAEAIAGREFAGRTRERVKPLLSFTYGTVGPLLLGLAAGRVGRGRFGRVVGAGAIMGVLVWAAGYLGWLPASGIAEPIHRQPIGASAQTFAGHALYGALSSLPIALVEKYVRQA
jgi:hypothetical protein